MFTSRNEAELLEEYYGDAIERRDSLLADAADADIRTRSEIMQTVSALNKLLGETKESLEYGDALAQEWDEVLDRGDVPDNLSEGIPDEIKKRLGLKE